MKTHHLASWLIGAFAWSAVHAAYPIGQKEIPVVTIQKNEREFAVYGGHPRLFFRDTDLPVIRERIRGEYAPEWKQLQDFIEDRALAQSPELLAKPPFTKEWALPRNVLFAAVVTGDSRYVEWSKRWAAALAATGPVGNDTEFRGRLQCLALAYDWVFAFLSDGEKKALEQAIIAHLDRAWYFAEGGTNYVGGHSRWGNFTLTAGLLAIVTERPEMREKLLVLRRHWIDGYFPAQSWIAVDGGYHMGWAYSAAYLTGSIHHAWSTATNDCVYFPWQRQIPLFWIYGRQGDGTYPNVGDTYTVVDDLNAYQPDLHMIAVGMFKDPYAAWSLKSDRLDRLADILYGDKSVRPIAPDDPSAPLPLAKHFRNAGMVVARDRWDAKTTLFQFSSPSFYSSNHLHRDANAFTLHYGGGLAIDSGLYDESGQKHGGYGGTHWRNYFTRTVAHNAIVVFDPAQKMTVLDEPASNDGGQIAKKEPVSLADIQPGGHAALDGITHYRDAADYTYAAGDATKAYDPERVKLAQREVIYLRNSSRAHPVVVVFDRVESVRPEFQKRFLLHTINQPALQGPLAVTENGGGRLSCLTLLPADARLELIGGPGREAWVDGKNYPWDETARPKPRREGGAWRLEVSPREARTRDYFLHVLFVDDAGAPAVGARDAVLTQTNDAATVDVAGWKITFPFVAGGEPVVKKSR